MDTKLQVGAETVTVSVKPTRSNSDRRADEKGVISGQSVIDLPENSETSWRPAFQLPAWGAERTLQCDDVFKHYGGLVFDSSAAP